MGETLVNSEDSKKLYIDNMINKAMQASFGEVTNELTVSFKKTVLIRDYETEVIEANSKLTVNREITGAERVFITSLMRIQMEYEAYCNLLMKGMVTQKEFNNRKECLVNEMQAIKSKAEAVLGKSLDNYLELKI